jgi:hypothetical protein
MERRRLGGMGAGPHDKRFRAEERINIHKSSAASPGGLGAGPHEKRFRTRLNLQSKLLHAGFTLHGPLLRGQQIM